MAENKVQFNLKNVHYAVLKEGEVPSWETPVSVPGAVTLTLNAQGSVTPFYADGLVYYRSIANNGYSGSLEMARFPDQMMVDVWGMNQQEADGVLVENCDTEPKQFALLYQIDGDVDDQLYCLYNCTATRPGIGSTTTTESKTPQTQSADISADPLMDGDVMARTSASSSSEVRNQWFKEVYKKSA